MIEVLEFIFQDFWHWAGTVVLIAVTTAPIHGMFSFTKQMITNKGNE